MSKTKKLRRTNKKGKPKNGKTRNGGKTNNKNCKTKCKNIFLDEIKQDKRYKLLQQFSSFFTKKNVVEDQANVVLDSTDIQNDEVFKDCVDKCEK